MARSVIGNLLERGLDRSEGGGDGLANLQLLVANFVA